MSFIQTQTSNSCILSKYLMHVSLTWLGLMVWTTTVGVHQRRIPSVELSTPSLLTFYFFTSPENTNSSWKGKAATRTAQRRTTAAVQGMQGCFENTFCARPLQFAYKHNRWVEDASLRALCFLYKYLELGETGWNVLFLFEECSTGFSSF